MQSTPVRILCTEDDADTRELITLVLNRNNCEVTTTEAPAAAIELARRSHFDLYLLDNWIPGMSGTDVCGELRRFDFVTPILFYERATYNLSNGDRQDASSRLEARLESPEMLAIERSGSTVTIASSRTPQSTFLADGRQRQEQLPSGRSAELIATLRGEQLIVSSTGSGDTDFSVTFDPIDNGRRLNVSRTIHSSQLTQPLIVKSV